MVDLGGWAFSYERGTPVVGKAASFFFVTPDPGPRRPLSLELSDTKESMSLKYERASVHNESSKVAFALDYRGTSLISKRRPLKPCSNPMPGALWWS